MAVFLQSYPAHARTANQRSQLHRPDALRPSHSSAAQPAAKFWHRMTLQHTKSNGVHARALFGLFQGCGPAHSLCRASAPVAPGMRSSPDLEIIHNDTAGSNLLCQTAHCILNCGSTCARKACQSSGYKSRMSRGRGVRWLHRRALTRERSFLRCVLNHSSASDSPSRCRSFIFSLHCNPQVFGQTVPRLSSSHSPDLSTDRYGASRNMRMGIPGHWACALVYNHGCSLVLTCTPLHRPPSSSFFSTVSELVFKAPLSCSSKPLAQSCLPDASVVLSTSVLMAHALNP